MHHANDMLQARITIWAADGRHLRDLIELHLYVKALVTRCGGVDLRVQSMPLARHFFFSAPASSIGLLEKKLAWFTKPTGHAVSAIFDPDVAIVVAIGAGHDGHAIEAKPCVNGHATRSDELPAAQDVREPISLSALEGLADGIWAGSQYSQATACC